MALSVQQFSSWRSMDIVTEPCRLNSSPGGFSTQIHANTSDLRHCNWSLISFRQSFPAHLESIRARRAETRTATFLWCYENKKLFSPTKMQIRKSFYILVLGWACFVIHSFTVEYAFDTSIPDEPSWLLAVTQHRRRD